MHSPRSEITPELWSPASSQYLAPREPNWSRTGTRIGMSANACSSVTRRTTLGRDVEFAPSRTGRSVRTDRMVAAADDRELAVAAICGRLRPAGFGHPDPIHLLQSQSLRQVTWVSCCDRGALQEHGDGLVTTRRFGEGWFELCWL